MSIYLQALSVLRGCLLAAAAGVALYEFLLKADLVPALPHRALNDLNWVAGYWLDRLLQAAGLAKSATADYAVAIVLLAGAALLALMGLPAAFLLHRSSQSSSSEPAGQAPSAPASDPTGDKVCGDATPDGVSSLVALLSLHGIAADAGQIKHRFGGAAIGLDDMLRLAKELGLKARILRTQVVEAHAYALAGNRGAEDGRLPADRQGRPG